MFLRKALRVVNILAGLLLAAGAGVFYWYGIRPLPRTSGELVAPVAAPISIVRDRLGVPHIHAASTEDAAFAQGFVTAQDRLWQMETMRRLAAGTLSEVVGPGALELDINARRLRMWRIAREEERRIDDESRRILAAYARGVNFYIENHRSNLPTEFAVLSFTPSPWTIADTLLVALQMDRTLTESYRRDLQKAAMLAGGKPELVDRLYPTDTAGEATPGSNAWVVAGSKTASGKPIVANDPHLEYGIPSVWHAVQIETRDGLNVMGVTLPGVPLVIIGRNNQVAWGITSLEFDGQDLYRERINLSNGVYLLDGKPAQARQEREVINVRGRRPESLVIWVTAHGPVLPVAGEGNFAIRWAANDAATFNFPLNRLNRARNWEEFRAALALFPGPPQNFVYGDAAGNIGYQVAGRVPVRRGFRGDVPLDGSTGKQEWDGYIPFDQLPSLYNPPSGIIVTANQNPFPQDYPYTVSGLFTPYYRARQIRQMLTGTNGKLTVERMQVIQKDVYSAFHRFLAAQIVAACDRRGVKTPPASDAVEVLRNWNGQMEIDSPAAVVTEFAFEAVRHELSDVAGKPGNRYSPAISYEVVERFLRQRPTGWVADWDDLLLESLNEAIEQGRRIAGPDVRKWKYGSYHHIALIHPVLGRLPVIGRGAWLLARNPFNIGVVPMSGAVTTVKQTTARLGPSMRMVVDFGAPAQSVLNLTLGESGQFASSHYRDQWEHYYNGTSLPMEFPNAKAVDTLVLKPR